MNELTYILNFTAFAYPIVRLMPFNVHVLIVDSAKMMFQFGDR